MRKFIFIIMTFLIFLPVPVFADMGPKPSIIINIDGLSDEECYMTLLSKEKASGPWSVYDGSEDTKRILEGASEKIWNAFVDYQDNDHYYFIQYFKNCTNHKKFEWLYYPPSDFKILLYFPESKDFIVSQSHYKRYSFDSYYEVTVYKNEKTMNVHSIQSSFNTSTNQHSSLNWIQPSLFIRIILTLCIELIIAYLFYIRHTKQMIIIMIINIITQLLFNAFLNMLPFHLTLNMLIFYYIGLEILVMISEAVIYLKSFPRYSKIHNKHIILYTMSANLSSFIIGFLLL